MLPDNVAGGEAATRHLLSLGHTRIGHLGGDLSSAVGKDRLAGYKRALSAAGVKYVASLVRGADFTFEHGYESARRIMSGRARPTALFCANDAIALGAMKQMHEMGLRIPDDVSVVGFDDIDAAAHVHPALTTVAVPKTKVARLAVDALFRSLDDVATSMSGRIVVETQLIERASFAAVGARR